ncbi:MAG TPA: formyltransferase family protein [Phycisphaerales bacterium]|nr:formyltransferase family protein [Phycisphaerales bacterium]
MPTTTPQSVVPSNVALPPGASFVLEPTLPGSKKSGYEFLVLETPGRTLRKYVFIQDETGYLPKVLDKYLREFADSTAGINIQGNQQGKRTTLETAKELLRVYGPAYFGYKATQMVWNKALGKVVNGLLGSTKRCYTVESVARKYGVPVHRTPDVNSEEFRSLLRSLGVEFIVSISGTQLYKKDLRMQTPFGIVNCHGALLPKYRGLMPSFWTLANGERWGGSSVHFVDRKLDNGPIVVQERYRIHPHDTLEDVMARSKDIAAEAIIRCVRLVEAGDPPLMPNPEAEQSHFAMPTRADVERFRKNGHRFW